MGSNLGLQICITTTFTQYYVYLQMVTTAVSLEPCKYEPETRGLSQLRNRS